MAKAGCSVENLLLAEAKWGRMIGLPGVFIPFHGPKAHSDSQDWLPHRSHN
jgi:hypothetical protein